MDHGPNESGFVLSMRIPVTIERGESGGRQGFIDRDKRVDPWIPLGYSPREIAKQ
jgi:hypothetical protein